MPASAKYETPLRKLLKARKMSQKELARQTGFSETWINAAVNGRASLPVNSMLVVEICRVLNVPKDALYGTGGKRFY